MDTPLGASAPPGLPQPLPGGEAALIGLAVLVVVMVPFLWPVARHFNVMAHEGAHALFAFALGFELENVILRKETGATKFGYASLTGLALRWIVVAFAGYLGPSLFGLGAAKLIESGRVIAVLWVAIILLVLLFFLIGRSLGLVSVPVAILLLVLATRYTHAGLEEVVVYAMTWLLLLSGLRFAIAHGINADDAAALRDRTHLPRRFWSLLWIAGALLAVGIGGKWMIIG